MHYLDEGHGSPILFVHGNPTWSFYWRRLVSDLSATHRCIAVDHIGCGLSDKPQKYPYTLAQHIDNLGELIETLDLRDITLVVHDWGGPIGLGTALRHRERFSRIVLFNTGCFEGPIPPEIRMCRWPGWGDAVIRGLNGFVRVGLFRATGDRSRFADGVAEGYLAPYSNWHDRIANLRFIQDIPLELDHPTRTLFLSIGEHLRTLSTLPIAILWGEKDFCFTPYYRRGFIERLPNAEVTVFEHASHWVVEDAYERILPIVQDFLARHPLGRAA
jgi:haloalkane dehalogenase